MEKVNGVFVIETSEPLAERFVDGLQAGIAEVFLTRETAEAAAAEYREQFPDDDNVKVVPIPVR